MKIAVTGASGFVGGHVLAALAAHKGVDVVASDRAAPKNLPTGANFVALDFTVAPTDAYALLGKPDVVMHLAWGGLPNYRSLHHFETELPAQYAFLRGMVAAGLPSLLVTGTCYEYGMASGMLDEARAPAPANAYGFAKTALLQQLQYLATQSPFALTWARLFYMHGEGQAPTSLYPLMQAAAARGDAVFPMSSGEQLRDYLPVTEVARLLAALAIRCPGAGVVNVCSGAPISVRLLAENFKASHNWTMTLDLGKYPVPDYEPLAFWGSAAKLNRLLES